jgi:hypothetical protein
MLRNISWLEEKRLVILYGIRVSYPSLLSTIVLWDVTIFLIYRFSLPQGGNWSHSLSFPTTFKFLMMVLLSQLWFISISLISFVVVFQIIGKFLKQKQLSILWNEIKEPRSEFIVLFKCCYYASSKSTCLWRLMKRILYFLSSLQFHKLKLFALLLNRKILRGFCGEQEKYW